MKILYKISFFIIFFAASSRGLIVKSPCPNVFRYIQKDRKIIGFLKAPTSVQQSKFILEVKTSVSAKINSNYAGDIEIITKTWADSCAALQKGSLNYYVYFPIQNPLPLIESIYINGQEICSGRKATGNYITSTTLKNTLSLNSVCPNNVATTPRTRSRINMRRQRPRISSPRRRPGSTNNYYPKEDNTIFQNNDICGIKGYITTPLIVDGRNTLKNAYPWLVAMYYKNSFNCGGNLISNEYILTAAHCITERHSDNYNDFTIILGANNLLEFDNDAVQRNVKSIYVHPDYKNHEDHKPDGDIAILVINPIRFTDSIKPICLFHSMPDLSRSVRQVAKVAGWGSNGINKFTKQLKDTDVQIVSNDECKNSNKNLKELITSRTFCAGVHGRGPCTGDSGGGIFLPTDNSQQKFYLRGLVSTSLSDVYSGCDVNNYAIYVDVGKFIPWIKEKCV